jgi:uncharacterized repeat protein (TIGR03803 family)
LALAIFIPAGGASASGFNLLYTFTGGTDGGDPFDALIDTKGNLYGTVFDGGTDGVGAVFKVARDGSETVLYSFAGGSDGSNPEAGLIKDAAGNLYGTTYFGGGSGCGGGGCGTVFKVAPDGTETVLYSFTGGSDGGGPNAGLIANEKGLLFGTTLNGGNGYGTVFEVAQDGTETVLYSFTGGNDGSTPVAGLIANRKGQLFGTTLNGGNDGYGTVFKVAPDGTETGLYSFTGGNDGGSPYAGLIEDAAGNFYGTTSSGGVSGAGTVFELARDRSETVLHSFTGGTDGGNPKASLINDAAGNLYGTTAYGGSNNDGTVFKLAPGGTETVLHSFTGGSDGSTPVAPLIANRKGHLFGMTPLGGADGYGTVFKLKE